jgi:hypothetical protein
MPANFFGEVCIVTGAFMLFQSVVDLCSEGVTASVNSQDLSINRASTSTKAPEINHPHNSFIILNQLLVPIKRPNQVITNLCTQSPQ